jgi:hypothetical protein
VAIEKSCGCTEVKADQTTLKPGETATLTGSLAAQDRLGEFGSTIQLTLSDGTITQAQVGAKAVAILHGPTSLDLGSSYIDEKPATQTFTFKKGGMTPFSGPRELRVNPWLVVDLHGLA